ncbi:MAG: ABC transporter substrate-binding protein, partial [Angelakisella sp.]
MKKTIALALAAIMCLGVFTGCSKKDEEVSYWDTYKSTFSEGLATLNPYTLGGTSDYGFVANILDGLVEADHYGRYVPALAESWEANDDFTVWTFHLRKGQYWIDSTGAKTEWEITSQNFVDSMRYIADPANGVNNFSTIRGVIAGLYDYYYLLADIDDGIVTDKKREDVVAAFGELVGVKAVDDYTLEYTLDGPVPYFLSYTEIELMLPLEQRFLDKVGEDFGTSKENMLYCGGYYISTWDRDKLLVLTKNENNWDKDNLTLKALSFEAVGDGISGVELFKRGQIATTKLSSEELSSVKSSDYGDYVYLSEKTLST